ncbi:MAG: zinc-binding dehydrogenase [Alphaproteobacteria bacterium]|nr:zinc-binding dehydrogenase [Alphaproteobacteria bacterium]
MIPRTMHAMLLTGFGGPEHLRHTEVPVPTLEDDEVLIRVRAAATNRVEIDIRRGLSGLGPPLPLVMGPDGAGEAVAVGVAVKDIVVGDHVLPHTMVSCGRCENCQRGRDNVCRRIRILGSTMWGCHAEYVVAPAHRVVKLPPELPFEVMAAGNKFCTAWEALAVTAGLRAGEVVLINAAAGGVGSCAVQVARHLGARVIAAVGSAAKIDQVRANGADEVIDYGTTDLLERVRSLTDGRGVDVGLDIAGGALFHPTLQSVTDGGRLALIGAHAGKMIEIDLTDLFRRHVAVMGCGRWTKAISQHVVGLLAAGALKPTIFKTMTLAALNEAHALMSDRTVNGRIVLLP